jgi:hypothetical protein
MQVLPQTFRYLLVLLLVDLLLWIRPSAIRGSIRVSARITGMQDEI